MWYFLDISSFILFAGFMEIIILSSSLIDDDDVDGVGKLTINHVVNCLKFNDDNVSLTKQ